MNLKQIIDDWKAYKKSMDACYPESSPMSLSTYDHVITALSEAMEVMEYGQECECGCTVYNDKARGWMEKYK